MGTRRKMQVMPDYHVHVDHGKDEETHTVRVTEEGKPETLLTFPFKHPIDGKLVKDARREALKKMAE
jgi:uncharacterized OsmC-like protein